MGALVARSWMRYVPERTRGAPVRRRAPDSACSARATTLPAYSSRAHRFFLSASVTDLSWQPRSLGWVRPSVAGTTCTLPPYLASSFSFATWVQSAVALRLLEPKTVGWAEK